MFTQARLKLTGWYLLIIMLVSVAFSGAIYKAFTNEVERFERMQRFRLERRLMDEELFLPGELHHSLPPIPNPNLELLQETKQRVFLFLAAVNIGILGISGAAAYFLAGKTLAPIETMVDEQKQFVADASHELRTPLTAIKSEVEVALRDKKLSLTQAKSLLKSNLEEVDKLQSFANYLLTLSRYENNRVSLPFTDVDLADVVEKAISKVESLARQKGITIKKELSTATVNGNAIALAELFTILLDNAIKYSHRDGNINITVNHEGKKAIVTIQDYGVGIKAADLPHIFDRFYRADTSRSKTQVDGYGLGLSIAKSIVELHHAKINAESTIDTGATFVIHFPTV